MFTEVPGTSVILTVQLSPPANRSIRAAYHLSIYGMNPDLGPGTPTRQVLGLTKDCLCITLRYPTRYESLSRLCGDLPYITWLGFLNGKTTRGGSTRFRIPTRVWYPTSTQYAGTHVVRGYGHYFDRVTGDFRYHLLYLPSFKRSGIILSTYNADVP